MVKTFFLKQDNYERILLVFTGALLLWIYYGILNDFLPLPNGNIAPDWLQVLAKYLQDYFWYRQNGLFSFPMFTPAVCGGIPNIPSSYFSLPQIFMIFFNPLVSVKLTIMIFAVSALTGMYLLLHHHFKINRTISFLGAVLFLFNGYMIHRYIRGHFAFHPHNLIPLFAYLIITIQTTEFRNHYQRISIMMVASLLLTYAFGFFFIGIIPFIISVLGILILYSIVYNKSVFIFVTPLMVTGSSSFLIMLFQIVPLLSMGHNFSRDFYSLAGFDSFFALLQFYFKSLFFAPDMKMVDAHLTNMSFLLERHEWETSISVIPLFIIVMAILRYKYLFKKIKNYTFSQSCLSLSIIVILFIPLFFNCYHEGWNQIIKSVPFIGSMSSFPRWFIINIPVIIVLAVLLFAQLDLNFKTEKILTAFFIIFIIIYNVTYDRTFYKNHAVTVNGCKKIITSYNTTKQSGRIPYIKTIGGAVNKDNKIVYIGVRYNMIFINGYSSYYCYNSFFGYRCEQFPAKELQLGPVKEIYYKNSFNMKNPACYLYPEENHCEPGDHFQKDQLKQLTQFIQYKPFTYNKSSAQKTADIISIVTFVLVVGLLTGGLLF